MTGESFPGAEPQPVLSPLTRAAIFLVVTVDAGGEQAVQEVLGDLSGLDAATLRSAIAELPRATGTPASPVAQLLVDSGLTSSLGESRRAIEQGGVYLNNERVEDAAALLGSAVLAGGIAVLRRGKRTLAGVVTS